MGWKSERTDPPKHFTIYVDGEDQPGDVEYTDPSTNKKKTLKSGAGWSECAEQPKEAVVGTRK